MFRKLFRAGHLSASDWLLLPILAFAALAAMVALRFTPLPRVLGWMSRLGRFPLAARGPRARTRLVRLADLATRVTHGEGRCLARSILLYSLLGARGGAVQLVVGVRRDRSDVRGHAWVRWADETLADREEEVGQYELLARFRAAEE